MSTRASTIDKLTGVLVMRLHEELGFIRAHEVSQGPEALVLGFVRVHACSRHWYAKIWCFAIGVFALAATAFIANGSSLQQGMLDGAAIASTILLVLVPACVVLRSIARRRFRHLFDAARAIIESDNVTIHEWDAAMQQAWRNPDLRVMLPLFEGLRKRCVQYAPVQSNLNTPLR